MKKISAAKKADKVLQQKVRAKLLLQCKTDSRGFPLCPQCGKLPDLKDGRGELHLCHEKSLAQGGRTSYRNCYLACRACHFGVNGHRTENVPHSKPVARPIPLLGKYGAYSKATQVGR